MALGFDRAERDRSQMPCVLQVSGWINQGRAGRVEPQIPETSGMANKTERNPTAPVSLHVSLRRRGKQLWPLIPDIAEGFAD